MKMTHTAALLLAFCAGGAFGEEDLPRLRYQPDPSVTLAAAVQALASLNVGTGELTLDRYPYSHSFSTPRPALALKPRLDRLELVHGPGADPAAPRAIPYEAMTRLGMVSDYGFRAASIDGRWYIWCVRIVDSDRREGCAKAIADYLQALKARAEFVRQSDLRFEEILTKYREPASRPALPEEARKHRIQAELALDGKRYGDAANSYVMAVRIAPWWADGYYNLALLKAELKEFDDAVRMMKRYLALEPGAKDARAEQDRIYRWEAEAR